MDILIVDDEQVAVQNLTELIQKAKPEAGIRTADSGEAALKLCKESLPDVAFLDIAMPGMDGLVLAKKLREIDPVINIVFATAFPEYALDSYKVFASGYILKPASEEDVRTALDNLRHPVRSGRKGLYVQCFGNFEVFMDGAAVKFSRSKAKELFAYLVDRRGSAATNGELRAVLWGDEADESEEQRRYFSQIVFALTIKLKEIGCAGVLIHSRDAYSVKTDKINCDYYAALDHDPKYISHFHGEYMSQYEWAEDRIGLIGEALGID